MTHISQSPAVERVMATDDETFGPSRVLSREKKGVVWMKDIIWKFTLPGQTAVDLWARTFATEKACMLQRRHRHFLGCEINAVCFKESLLGVVKVFPRQILNEESEIVSAANVQDAAKVFVSETDCIDARRKKVLWAAQSGLCLTQSFSVHIMHFLSNCFWEPSLYDMRKDLPLSQWSEMGLGRVYTINLDASLPANSGRADVTLE